MCKYIYIIVLLCFSMFFACKHTKETVESMESALYTINLDNITTIDNFRMSSIFRKAKAIRLEETDYAVIGEINSMQVFDNYIFILDNDKAKKLFMFDKNGKYLRQIGRLGQGPGEYTKGRSYNVVWERWSCTTSTGNCCLASSQGVIIKSIN